MTQKELQKIINYINNIIRSTISTDDSETNDIIEKGFFTEKEFLEQDIVEINNE